MVRCVSMRKPPAVVARGEVASPFLPNGHRKPSSLLHEKSFQKINESMPYVNRTPSKVFIEKLEVLTKMGPRRLRYLRSSYECEIPSESQMFLFIKLLYLAFVWIFVVICIIFVAFFF